MSPSDIVTQSDFFCIFLRKKSCRNDFPSIPRVGPLRTLYDIGMDLKRILWAFQQKKPRVNPTKTRFKRVQCLHALKHKKTPTEKARNLGAYFHVRKCVSQL